MHRGRWEYAEELFAEALEMNKSDDRAHWGMGESLWHRGDRTAALEEMKTAVRLSGSHPELVVRLGRMHFENGDWEAAENYANEALLVGRDLPGTWALRGDCLQRAGDQEKALAAYHRALALQPEYPEVQLQAAELYRQQGRYDRLLATLERIRDCTGDAGCSPRVHLLRGVALSQLGRPGEASNCFNLAAQMQPHDANIQLQIATLALEMDEFDTARLATRRILEIDPQSSIGSELNQQIDHRIQIARKEEPGSRTWE